MKTVPKMLLCLARIAAILIFLSYVQTTRKSDLTDTTDITDITVDPRGILCDEHSYFLQTYIMRRKLLERD